MDIAPIRESVGQLSWLLDAKELIAFVVFGGSGAYALTKAFRSASSFSGLVEKLDIHWSDESAKHIASVAIVDDQLGDFPVSDLKKAGYQITPYDNVAIADFHSLASFDVVFLDMRGIVRDDVEHGGMRLIKFLKEHHPRQRICAVSGTAFDVTASDFFLLANVRKKKPITAHECQDVIESQARHKLDPVELAAALDRTLLPELGLRARLKIISLERFVSGHRPPSGACQALHLTQVQCQKYSGELVDLVRTLRSAH